MCTHIAKGTQKGVAKAGMSFQNCTKVKITDDLLWLYDYWKITVIKFGARGIKKIHVIK